MVLEDPGRTPSSPWWAGMSPPWSASSSSGRDQGESRGLS
jgi:hypothetical protein